jgi:hypothetical protein
MAKWEFLVSKNDNELPIYDSNTSSGYQATPFWRGGGSAENIPVTPRRGLAFEPYLDATLFSLKSSIKLLAGSLTDTCATQIIAAFHPCINLKILSSSDLQSTRRGNTIFH